MDNDLIKVFPNPIDGLFTIKTKNTFERLIYDNLGREACQTKKAQSGSQIDLSEPNPGIYLLKNHRIFVFIGKELFYNKDY